MSVSVSVGVVVGVSVRRESRCVQKRRRGVRGGQDRTLNTRQHFTPISSSQLSSLILPHERMRIQVNSNRLIHEQRKMSQTHLDDACVRFQDSHP